MGAVAQGPPVFVRVASGLDLPVFVGVEKGIFAKHGLRVKRK